MKNSMKRQPARSPARTIAGRERVESCANQVAAGGKGSEIEAELAFLELSRRETDGD